MEIAAILKSKKNELNMNYIEKWAARLLSAVWKEMLDKVSSDPVICTMQRQTPQSGMIDVLGIQFSTH